MNYNGTKVLDFAPYCLEKGEWLVKLADGTTTVLTASQALEIGIGEESAELPSVEPEQVEPTEEETKPKKRGRPKKV